MVDPLDAGVRIAERFETLGVLGRGGFSIVYDVLDIRRGDRAVLKEFVPPEARRNEGGLLDLGPSAATLRHAFLDEARTVGRLAIHGVLAVRLAFVANGTAYVATDRVEGASTLDAIVREEGPLDSTRLLDLAYQLMETLAAVHDGGLLHRDLKPSNVLVAPDGRAFLLDFGAARAWTADALDVHTVLYTPGYAPPEQRSAVARRGPALDVYALCATLYAALSGRAPTDAAARAGGEPLPSLAERRPDLDGALIEAIERGLALNPGERPQSVAELRRLLDDGGDVGALDTLDALDALLVRSQRFAHARRACPACPGILSEARPLARDVCPVCRRGKIRLRRLDPRVCPICRTGVLHRPSRRWAKGAVEDPLTCDGCAVRFDPETDGQWRLAGSERRMYPDAWARVAAGLPATAGDLFCDGCDADFVFHADRLTLLRAPEDPHGFAAAYLLRPLPRERVRWLAVGKRSPHPGLVCDRCVTEFDHSARLLRLVDSTDRRLARYAGEIRGLEAWHRIAEGLPEPGQEIDLEARIATVLVAAYRRGEVGFGELAWRGPATFDGRATMLIARDEGLRIGRGLRIRQMPIVDLQNLRAEGDRLLAEGPDGPFEIGVEPVEMVARLRSGDRAVLLTAEDLSARLAWRDITRRFRAD